MYDPTTLPEIEAVGVYTFRDHIPSISGHNAEEQKLMLTDVTNFKVHDREFPVAKSIITRDFAATTVAHLWRQLPENQQMRCHFPAYGLRFVHNGRVILSASLCWACNNIYISTQEEDTVYMFDGRAPVSQQLFTYLQEHLPYSPT